MVCDCGLMVCDRYDTYIQFLSVTSYLSISRIYIHEILNLFYIVCCKAPFTKSETCIEQLCSSYIS